MGMRKTKRKKRNYFFKIKVSRIPLKPKKENFMMQFFLIASLMFNVGLVYKVEYSDEDQCTECNAYEDFLEEWHNYDELRQQRQAQDFEYQLLPEYCDEEEPPTEEI
ncbi:MAG: hypothetical protein EBR82_76580 [Caulobacteraceae bacterium]|nr:hypothetical protein [Caulobacteraceae bacterium]